MANQKPSKARSGAEAAKEARTPKQPKPRARKAPPVQRPELEFDSSEVNQTLFPTGKTIKLSDGTSVTIKPWSIKMFGEMSQRIPQTFDIAAGGGEEGETSNQYAAMFSLLIDEVVFMVAHTIDWKEEDVKERMSMDELLYVSTEIWDICIQGPMAKIGSLMGKVLGSAVGVAAPLRGQAPTKMMTAEKVLG